MHIYLQRVLARYGLSTEDVFFLVYESQFDFQYKGYRLSYNLPDAVKEYCVQLIERP